MEKCNICNSVVLEITLFNGETKNFCSVECVKAKDIIDTFKDYIQHIIDKYQHTSKEELVDFLYPQLDKKKIKDLISEISRRGYFHIDRHGFIYPKNKIIKIPR